MKPKLLVVEIWQLGDLVIGSPFLQAASERYEVTLIAKPFAHDLQARFWPGIKVIPFVAPWTAFQRKYYLPKWPWRQMLRLWRLLPRSQFDVGISARIGSDLGGDPRDHLLLRFSGAKRRLGFPGFGSRLLLNEPLKRPEPATHRYDNWRAMAQGLGFSLPPRDKIPLPRRKADGHVLVHTGAGQPVRVWPLERYRNLVARLRKKGFQVQVVCDSDQLSWWLEAGESRVATPPTVSDLLKLLDEAGVLIGNDSGPGHLAAFCGVPSFSIFGPQLPEWFAPLHPAAEWLEGKACPYKPCFDYCRFPAPYCIVNSTEDEVVAKVEGFVARILSPQAIPTTPG